MGQVNHIKNYGSKVYKKQCMDQLIHSALLINRCYNGIKEAKHRLYIVGT